MEAAETLIGLDDWTRWSLFQGALLTEQGRYHEAMDLYDTVIAQGPPDAYQLEIGSARALVSLCLEDYAGAYRIYTELIDAFEPNVTPWLNYYRATVLWMLGRLEEAAADCRSFRRIHGQPLYAGARLFLLDQERARLLRDRGQAEAARALAEQARAELEVTLAGVESGSWLAEILDCLAGLRSPDELIRAADPNDPEQVCESYYYAAEAHLLRNEIDAARRRFRDCVETGLAFDADQLPLDPMSEYHLARWRLKQLGPGPGDRD